MRWSQWPWGLRPLACWNYGFESHRGHGCLSVVSVVWYQAEVFATGRSLECGASGCDLEAPLMRKPWPTRGCCAQTKLYWLMWLESLRAVNITSLVLYVTSWSLGGVHRRFKWTYSVARVVKIPSYPENGDTVTL